MIPVPLTARDRRTLGVGALTISALLGGARGLPAVRAWSSERLERARAASGELASARANAVLLPALRDSLRARRARLASLDSTLLSGATPAAIGAALASMVEEIADENAMKLTALQLYADTIAVTGLVRAEARLTATADVVGLAGFLRDVDGGPLRLMVHDLAISQPTPAASDSKPEALHIDITVAGLGVVREAGVSAHP